MHLPSPKTVGLIAAWVSCALLRAAEPLPTYRDPTYLPAFEALVREGHAEIVMTAYHSLYGTPCSISPLLYGLLDEWNFSGHVTPDCGSLSDLICTFPGGHGAHEEDPRGVATLIEQAVNDRSTPVTSN